MCQRRQSLNSALGCCSLHAVMQPGCISRLDSPHLPAPTWEKGGNSDAISSPSNLEEDKKQVLVLIPFPPTTQLSLCPGRRHILHLPHSSPSLFSWPFSPLVTFPLAHPGLGADLAQPSHTAYTLGAFSFGHGASFHTQLATGRVQLKNPGTASSQNSPAWLVVMLTETCCGGKGLLLETPLTAWISKV